MEKKNVVFLTVLAVATLLTAVVGTTFAYFTATVQTNGNVNPTTITTANNLGITYSDGDEITGTTIIPGWKSIEKTITVVNHGDTAVNYQLAWNVTANSFVQGTGDTDDLVYSLYEGDTALATGANTPILANGYTRESGFAYSLTAGTVVIGTEAEAATAKSVAAVPGVGTSILVPSRSIAANATHTFKLQVYFVESGINQNANQSNSNENKTVNFTATVVPTIVTTAGIHAN